MLAIDDKPWFVDEISKKSTSYHEFLQMVNLPLDHLFDCLPGNAEGFLVILTKALAIGADLAINEFEAGRCLLRETLCIRDEKCYGDNSANQIVSHEVLVERIISSKARLTLATSGTTGQPKRVTHQINTLLRQVRLGDKYNDNVWGFAYNPSHIAGLQVFFQALLNKNTTINLFQHPRDVVLEAIENHKITHISATPTFYRLIVPGEKKLESVSHITLGGEKSDYRIIENIKKVFPKSKIFNVYASTEAGSIFATNGSSFSIPETLADKVKVENLEVYIHRSILGESMDIKTDGEWYATGDLVEWVDDAKKSFRFVSRRNEMINIGGYKVNPTKVEDVIYSVGFVKQVSVYGKVNSVLGHVLVADVVLNEGAECTEQLLIKFISKMLYAHEVPRRVYFMDSITINLNGKISRRHDRK
jgi:acyl-coenzyme A synthetase/AMP-(fatty) acid ligase